jgi:hypothetical protein
MLLLVNPVVQNTANAPLSTTLDIIDKAVKVIAVLIAGVWGYLNYRRGRTFKRRLEPRISGKVFRSNGAWLLCGLAQLKNVGLSKVTIEQKGTAIVVDDQLLMYDPVGVPRVESERVAVLEVFKVHGWIEPGEPIEQSFLRVLPERANRVAIHLRLRIVSPASWWRRALARMTGPLGMRVNCRGIEWNDDSIAEIVLDSAQTEPSKPVTLPLTEMPEESERTDKIGTKKLPVGS